MANRDREKLWYKVASVSAEVVLICPACRESILPPDGASFWSDEELKQLGSGGHAQCLKCGNGYRMPAKLMNFLSGL